MPRVELRAGTIEYQDTAAAGLVVVVVVVVLLLLHGLPMDSSLWRHVVGELRTDRRCVASTLPLDGHRRLRAWR
jgi:pimeloyl-ACP methyl ester carboxylesterase